MSRTESWIGKGLVRVKTSPDTLKKLNKRVKKSNYVESKPKQMTLPLD